MKWQVKTTLCLTAIALLAACANPPTTGRVVTANTLMIHNNHPMLRRAPADMADGEQIIRHSNGRYMKTVVRNGILDEYADVYYPSGKLQSHTKLVAGLAQGWSEGYRESGQLMSRLLYRDGQIVRWQQFDANGKMIREGEGAPR